MTEQTELWVKRDELRNTRIVTGPVPEPAVGQILVTIDKFALTANNVSYGVSGDTIGYWDFYPAGDEWGKVPVWGCGNVVASNGAEVQVGERLWGFFPMASHAVLRPGKVREDHFFDVAPHRGGLPALYNSYRRTQAEPGFLSKMENERCLLFPLLITSFMLKDYLVDNGFFGAEQVLIGSVSSKTGFGLARMLHEDPAISQRVVGLTSAANRAFVEGLDCCDQVITYGEEQEIDAALPAAYVDMSGDASLTRTVHELLGENMVVSVMVGATHWEQRGQLPQLPGAKPAFFFAPAQIAKRDAQWGSGVVMARATEASAEAAGFLLSRMHVDWTNDVEALADLWVNLLDNQVAPSRGLMVSLGQISAS